MRKWISAAVAVGLGTAFVWLCLLLRDDFPARWAAVEAGFLAEQVLSLLGEPSSRVPADTLPSLEFLPAAWTQEFWIYDRPVGLGHTVARHVLLLHGDVVIQKDPDER